MVWGWGRLARDTVKREALRCAGPRYMELFSDKTLAQVRRRCWS